MFRKSNMGPASGVVFLLLIIIHYGQCCGPAEIGQPYTITSTASVPSDASVSWDIFDRSSTTLYDSYISTPNLFPAYYVGSRRQLTIKNVRKVDETGDFRHRVNDVEVYQCKLPVYKRANAPSCEHVTLTGNQFRTKCTSTEVYPQAKCQFTLQNGVMDRKIVQDGASYITYNHTDPKPDGNEYYNTSCTLQYPVQGLKPGNWTVQVNMYPNLTGVSLAQGTTGKAASFVSLSVPTVYIDPNSCPKRLVGESNTNVENGYIKQGERASCLCTRDHAGNPPGTVGWSSAQEGSFANLSQSAEAATIEINFAGGSLIAMRPYRIKTIVYMVSSIGCTASLCHDYVGLKECEVNIHNENVFDELDGPISASLTFQPPGPIYLCPNQQTNIDITCQVPKNSFNPAVLFTVRHDTSTNLVIKVAGESAMSKSVNYNFTKPGQHTFTCRVENAVFSDIFSEAPARDMQVYEPPIEPPRISARSRQHGDVLMVGDDVTVTCDVSGGYSSVQSVTLTCGQDMSVTRNGTSAYLTLDKIELKCPAINCTCQATHVTGCYDLKASTFLKLNEDDKSPYTTAELVGTAIGSIAGTLILEAVISVIVFIIRREKVKRRNRNNDTEYDEVEKPQAQRYQNVGLRDPNYLKINASGQTPVPKSESAKQKTEHIYSNQVFGDDADTTEPDSNAYCYIKDE